MWVPEVGRGGDSGVECGGGCGGCGDCGDGGGIVVCVCRNKSYLLGGGCFLAASHIAELRKSCSRSQLAWLRRRGSLSPRIAFNPLFWEQYFGSGFDFMQPGESVLKKMFLTKKIAKTTRTGSA